MKKTLLIAMLLFASVKLMAQTDGMSYQAVIISPNTQEIPGVDATGNILPNKPLSVRFSISDSSGSVEFQETHTTTTDAYGMINLVIGHGSSSVGSFTEIVWDGTQKDLKVEINLDGGYKDLSNQALLFTPYAFHRDIIATGDLTVGGKIGFSGDLEVDGTTILNNTLLVANGTSTNLTGVLNVEGKTTLKDAFVVTNTSPSELSGKLTVLGATELNNTLDVSGATGIKNSLTVSGQNPTALTGTLAVDGVTNLNNTLNVTNGSPVNLSGDLKIGGVLELGNDLTVNGITNLNKELKVNNQSATLLTGRLDVDGPTALKNELQVSGATNLNGSLSVNNESPTGLTGTLTVDKETTLNNALTVTNESPTNLTGTLTADGATIINNTLDVKGAFTLGDDLTVNGKTNLNSSLSVNNASPTNLTGKLDVDGETELNNRLTVVGGTYLYDYLIVGTSKPTTLTGTLNVGQAATLNNSLTVANASPTSLTGELSVDGATVLNNTLNVADGSSTTLTGTLHVGLDATFEKNIKVTDTVFTDVLQANKLNIVANVPDGFYLTTFENTNDDKGDGLLIKLGKARANDGLPDYQVDVTDAATTDKYRLLLSNEIDTGAKVVILRDLAAEIAKNDVQFLLNTTLGIGNMLIQGLNTAIDLPWTTRKLMVAMNGCDPYVLADGSFVLPDADGDYEPAGPCHDEDTDYWAEQNSGWIADGDVPGPGEGFTFFPEIPTIPAFSFTIPKLEGVFPESEEGRTITIEPYDFTDPNFWEIPSLNLKDFVSNPLNDSNEFITFADKNGIRMGAIKAQSVEDWVFKYLDAQFMFKLRDAAKSTFDKKHAKWHMKSLISSAILSYKDIGVVYSSGNGDYAEWLERLDASENISTGDIVAVIGGKITKDLTNAEQVMAVSYQPIVLGNIPADGKNDLGNNIAFMGQIPVKIMGSVNSGDYIVGKGDIKGFGVAISPQNMTLEDFKLVVGRSWEDNLNNGPKMVNTVVGIHNGNYIKILQKYEVKIKENSERLQNVEAKIDNLTQMITTYN